MPHANSTTSKPLVTEPLESSKVFPCSFEIRVARSSKFFSINSLYFDKILDLLSGVNCDQLTKLFF